MKIFPAILLILAGICFLFSWMICDMFYDQRAAYWDQVMERARLVEYGFGNPYVFKWHALRWQLFAVERVCFLWFIQLSVNQAWKPIVIVLLVFAFGNLIDRVFFDVYVYSWNDLILYLFAAWWLFKSYFSRQYLLMTIFFRYCLSKLGVRWHKDT